MYSDRQTWTISVDPDEMSQKAPHHGTLFATHPAIYRSNKLHVVPVQFLEQVW